MKVTKARIKNTIYPLITPLTSRLYRDDDWCAVGNLLATIRCALSSLGAGLTLSVSVKDGGYRTSADGLSKWKEHCLSIEDEDGNQVMGGTLNAHAAGSVKDPFDRYDMTVVLW